MSKQAKLFSITRYFFALCWLLSVTNAYSKECQRANTAYNSMPPVNIYIQPLASDSSLEFEAKLADNNVTRAAGFQYICESTIEDNPILFVFARETQPRFHMRNVIAPLDIAFIDKNGYIISIQTMQPYVLGAVDKPTYFPPKPVVAALEAHAGFFAKQKIDLNSQINWRKTMPLD